MATVPNIATNRGDFPIGTLDPDQAARLQYLAGSYNGSGDQANGSAPPRDTESYTQPSIAPSNRYQEIDDPAALLESLASFDQVVARSETPVSTDQFASLLQAAATAGGADAARSDQDQRRNSQSGPSEQYTFPQIGRTASVKRKRDEEIKEFGLVGSGQSGKRRKQEDEEEEDPDQLAREREIWGEEYRDDTPSTFEYHTTAAEVAEDARAAGVHSAAALFRRPSAASRKYTRPPMSKLFTSLELTPEQFLHLQAAAKSYMLDEQHPERSDCVGGRGRGDTDMTKLKLFACVKAFLDDEGWGERCFGEKAPGAAKRKLKYPEMKNKIISLITPLLRRMVTNERQRVYANTMRKNSRSGNKRASTGTPQPGSQPGSPPVFQQQSPASPHYSAFSALSALSVMSTIDPKLDPYFHSNPNLPGRDDQVAKLDPDVVCTEEETESGVRYHVNLLHEGRRVRPKLTLTPSSCPGFPSLVQHVHNLASDEGLPKPNSIQVLGARGLVDVIDEASWINVIEGVRQNEWMDGEVRVIAQAII